MADAPPISFLLVEELFAAGDPRFLANLRVFNDPQPMSAFAGRWLRDPRPWAREQMLAYVDQPLNAPNHNSLVKRLFKGAEARNDDVLIAMWAVAFDRLVRRVRKKRARWDYKTRAMVTEERLVTPRDRVQYFPGHSYVNHYTKETILYGKRGWHGSRLFSYHTRYYLRRRAWRYFRRMGHQRPADFVPAVSAMIGAFTDADLATGDHLMDNWSLLHACFGESDQVEFTTHRARLVGGSLAALSAAPAFGELWKEPSAGARLLALLTTARSTFARVWSTDLLRRWHADTLAGLSIDEITPLLFHQAEDVRTIGLELFEKARGLDELPLDRWLMLLQSKQLAVLDAVASAMRRHVDPSAVTLFDAVNLTRAEPAPVAKLGLHFLKTHAIDTPEKRRAVSHLATAKCAAAAYDIAGWALDQIGRPGVYDVEQVTRFFDSLLVEMRRAAVEWLRRADAPGWSDPSLWSRLMESPFDDIRAFLVDALERRRIPGATDDALTALWAGVLLNIHRGGRKKLSALRQISDAIRENPSRAEALLPVLAVAIRSVRAPETRAGLSAIVSAVASRPELAGRVKQAIPELEMDPEPLTV